MFIIPGEQGKDVCDSKLRPTRRDLIRIGGSGVLGLGLGGMFTLQARSARAATEKKSRRGAPGWGKAKSVIMIFLQGGPSHIDLWDPKENVPDNVQSVFSNISTKLPGVIRPR